MKTRIHFLDNLRTFMIFLVIVLHAGLVYEYVLDSIWIVSDPEKDGTIGLIRMYLNLFIMFVLFFISGYLIPRSLDRQTSKAYVISKFKRVMVPWIVAVFMMIPAYKAIFLYSRGMPQEAWFTYFHFFEREGGNMAFYADNPSMGWLWFLPVLFLFQVVYLLMAKTNLLKLRIQLKPAVIITIVLGITYSMLISSLGLRGWYHSALIHFETDRIFVYFMVFLLGSLCYRIEIFKWQKWSRSIYILTNVVFSISLAVFTVVALNLFFNMIEPGREIYFISPFGDRLVYYATMIFSMLGFLYLLLHLFCRKMNHSNRLMTELNKNSYFVYIIHMPVIGLVALPLLGISIPVYVKFLIVTVLSFILSNLLVSLYRRSLQRSLSNKWIVAAIVPASFLLGVFIYAQEEQFPVPSETTITEDVAPAISIHMAAIQGDLKTVEQHIKTGTDVNLKEPSAESTPLISAALFGHKEIVKTLIAAGASVNYQNKEGSTALHTAAFFCRTEIVELLLEHAADPSIKNNTGSTAFESVQAPFEIVKPIYDYFQNTLGPLGLKLDYDHLQITRPIVAEKLKNNTSKKQQ